MAEMHTHSEYTVQLDALSHVRLEAVVAALQLQSPDMTIDDCLDHVFLTGLNATALALHTTFDRANEERHHG